MPFSTIKSSTIIAKPCPTVAAPVSYHTSSAIQSISDFKKPTHPHCLKSPTRPPPPFSNLLSAMFLFFRLLPPNNTLEIGMGWVHWGLTSFCFSAVCALNSVYTLNTYFKSKSKSNCPCKVNLNKTFDSYSPTYHMYEYVRVSFSQTNYSTAPKMYYLKTVHPRRFPAP